MSTPHSAIKTRAVLTLTPGIVNGSSTSSAWSSQAVPMRAVEGGDRPLERVDVGEEAGDEVGERRSAGDLRSQPGFGELGQSPRTRRCAHGYIRLGGISLPPTSRERARPETRPGRRA